MTRNDIKQSLIKLEILWENTSNESSDDLDAYDVISVQSMSLKMTALQLKETLDDKIRRDKRARMKFQRLQKSLGNIVEKLDFKLQIHKDKEQIEYILKKLSEIEKDIDVIKMYQ